MASQISQSPDLWDLGRCLTESHKEIDRKYGYGYSQHAGFGRLLYERRVTEQDLAGLHENKSKSIRSS
jgi:hypothetical protein